MIGTNEDSLICDFMQYYHVLDYRELPLDKAALLAFGLPNESRIKKEISGSNTDLNNMLSAGILDRLTTLVWFKTKDGRKNRNRPKSVMEILSGRKERKQERSFATAEEFETTRQRLLKGVENG